MVQVDGQLKTGRDVVIAALLGAEEFGFATAPLVVSGCVHDARLPPGHLPGRRRHPEPGAAQAVHRQARVRGHFFEFLAEEVREYLAELGFRTLDEAVGQAELLDTAAGGGRTGRRAGLDLTAVLHVPELPPAPPGTRSPARRTTAWTGRWTTR